jgi:hypothetical protein
MMTAITHPPNNAVITAGALRISGTAPPNSLVQVMDWFLPVGQAIADESGQWSLEIENLVEGNHAYRSVATDEVGGKTISALHWVIAKQQLTAREAASSTRRAVLFIGACIVGAILAVAIVYLARHWSSSLAQTRHAPEPVATLVPARGWSFPAVPARVDETVLLLSNRNRIPVNVSVEAASGKQLARTRIPKDTGGEVDLAPPSAAAALTVHASAPVVVRRTVIRHGSVRTSPGHPIP